MHLPRDPGEWLFMALLMAVVMAVGMIGAHGLRSHLHGHAPRGSAANPGSTEDAGAMSPGLAMTAVTWVVARALALGVPIAILGPMMLLTVTGRKSGRERTLPIDVHDLGGRRYLIASHGIGSWVLNLRACGEGSLRLGRRRTAFVARELEPEDAGPVIRAAFAQLIASESWRGRGIRANLGVSASSPDADFIASARQHPVFELQPKPAQAEGRSDTRPPHRHVHAPQADDGAIRAVVASFVVLAVTAAIQLGVVLASGSVGLLADTIHNVSDATTAVPLGLAFVLGRRAATRRYTFGYGRAEDLAGLVVLLVIAASMSLAGWEAVDRLLHPQAISNVAAVIAAGFVGVLGNEVAAAYRIRVGRRIGSAALVADGLHARTDGLASLAVVIGGLGVAAGFPLADPIAGLAITGVILLVLRDAAREVLARLMDAVDPSLVDRAEALATSVPGVKGVAQLRLRWVGHALDSSLAVTVDQELSVAAGHDIADAVRHRLLDGLPGLGNALVHVDPLSPDARP